MIIDWIQIRRTRSDQSVQMQVGKPVFSGEKSCELRTIREDKKVIHVEINMSEK